MSSLSLREDIPEMSDPEGEKKKDSKIKKEWNKMK